MSEDLQGPSSQPREGTGYTLIRMLFYTFLMVTCPVSSYFASKRLLFESLFGLDEDSSIVPSAITSIVVIHIILGLFVYAAFWEKSSSKEKNE